MVFKKGEENRTEEGGLHGIKKTLLPESEIHAPLESDKSPPLFGWGGGIEQLNRGAGKEGRIS